MTDTGRAEHFGAQGSDVVKNARTIGRLIWLHVPNSISKLPNDLSAKERAKESQRVLSEKRVGLTFGSRVSSHGIVYRFNSLSDQRFAIALKHHLRGETGVYYEDLYHLVKTVPHALNSSSTASTSTAFHSTDGEQTSYGTFQNIDQPGHNRDAPTPPSPTSTEPLLPANRPPPNFPAPSPSLTPFTSILIPFTALLGLFSWIAVKTTANPHDDIEQGANGDGGTNHGVGAPILNVQRKFTVGRKYYPLVAGESGPNLPLAILRRLSEWIAQLENRGSTGGATIGGMLGCIAAFEDQLTGLEKILTTPLPFVYSVHIRQ
ncbi:unnamed protein product [Rhizoctonia solani]|uniref:Uncharacterized protein n=1 Tax=Rhizoctonia solani TaxID=456999 RepID=A0A8H3DZD0_9AGAM|nr:unnamed protein product [Rhizoctonia solani]